MKEERLQLYHRNTKDCKKLLQRTVCQEIWKPRWNGHILEKYNLPNLNEETEGLKKPITADEIEAVKKQTKTKKQKNKQKKQ